MTAFLRLEDEDGNAVGEAAGVGKAVEVKEGRLEGSAEDALKAANEGQGTELTRMQNAAGIGGGANGGGEEGEKSSAGQIKEKIKNVLTGRSNDFTSDGSSGGGTGGGGEGPPQVATPTAEVRGPAEVKKAAKRTLYTANVGDARAVLS